MREKRRDNDIYVEKGAGKTKCHVSREQGRYFQQSKILAVGGGGVSCIKDERAANVI